MEKEEEGLLRKNRKKSENSNLNKLPSLFSPPPHPHLPPQRSRAQASTRPRPRRS